MKPIKEKKPLTTGKDNYDHAASNNSCKHDWAIDKSLNSCCRKCGLVVKKHIIINSK